MTRIKLLLQCRLLGAHQRVHLYDRDGVSHGMCSRCKVDMCGGAS